MEDRDDPPYRSADRDVLRETIARKEFEGPVQRKLFCVARRNLPAHDHLASDFFHHEVADPAVSELANLGLDALRQAREGVRTIESHGVSISKVRNKKRTRRRDPRWIPRRPSHASC